MTRIGIIVEGHGELPLFENLVKRIVSKAEILGRPLRSDLQPKSNANIIARAAASSIRIFHRRKVDCVVVAIDREDHPCVMQFAKELGESFTKMYEDLGIEFRIVIKNSCIENWLVADIQALKSMRARFSVQTALERHLESNCADQLGDAIGVLNKSCKKGRYHKGDDPAAISQHQDPLRMAENSRSFRKFMRCVESQQYLDQSRLPYQAVRRKASAQRARSAG
jgi:hypothetical protein